MDSKAPPSVGAGSLSAFNRKERSAYLPKALALGATPCRCRVIQKTWLLHSADDPTRRALSNTDAPNKDKIIGLFNPKIRNSTKNLNKLSKMMPKTMLRQLYNSHPKG